MNAPQCSQVHDVANSVVSKVELTTHYLGNRLQLSVPEPGSRIILGITISRKVTRLWPFRPFPESFSTFSWIIKNGLLAYQSIPSILRLKFSGKITSVYKMAFIIILPWELYLPLPSAMCMIHTRYLLYLYTTEDWRVCVNCNTKLMTLSLIENITRSSLPRLSIMIFWCMLHAMWHAFYNIAKTSWCLRFCNLHLLQVSFHTQSKQFYLVQDSVSAR